MIANVSRRADRAAILAREAAHHDQLVAGSDPLAAPPGDPDWFEAALLGAAGPVTGLSVLDYGCGEGGLSLLLAQAGAARVTGVDISPATLAFAARRAQAFTPGADIDFVVADAGATGLAAESFDLVVGKFILHHLDVVPALREVRRLLKPGGRAVFIETSALNPILRLARRYIVHANRMGTAKFGTSDEHPLGLRDLRAVRQVFPGAVIDFPTFWFWRVYARNVKDWRSDAWNRRAHAWDGFVERRLRPLRPLSYYVRISVGR
jgi:SAM-dependent methyltransferase